MLSMVGNINSSHYCFSTEIFCGNHICSKLNMGLIWLKEGSYHELQSLTLVSILVHLAVDNQELTWMKL